ncbi:MAG TPA: hypothetical protein PLN42_10560 [Anaerolineae bacterium]|nr:hypothetical protein [Anaerolineae bacterium]
MTTPVETKPSGGSAFSAGRVVALFFGLGLIGLGGLLLLGELFHLNFWGLLWPFFIIGPGVLLFALSLFAGSGGGGEALAIVGGIITTVGLILFFQNATDLWATWAYAWALIAPTSIGVSQLVYGLFKGRRDLVRSGLSVAGVGLVIFLVAGAFFELALNISGFGVGPLGLSFFLIGLGVLLVLINLFRGLRK